MDKHPLFGKTFGDFVVQERIGRGGMASVYRATQQSMQRDVALKVIDLDDNFQPDNNFAERFAREAALIASLEHIHILPVYTYGIEGSYAYLAMRLLNGGTVQDVIDERKRLSVNEATRIFYQVSQGLAYAHNRGIIHRDIKPGNILLDDNNNAYLADFGLAKMTETGSANLTRNNEMIGTLLYMAPEQIRGEVLDHRLDIYSMGCLLFHMLTGELPFEPDPEKGTANVLYQHLQDTPPHLSSVVPSLPPQLNDVIHKALEKDPNERYQTVGEMADDLRKIAGVSLNLSLSSTSFPPVADTLMNQLRNQPEPKIQRLVPITMIASVLALMLLGFAAFGFWSANQNVQLPIHTILVDERIPASELVPDEEQISRAQQRLGADGVIAIVACNMTSEYHATLNREVTTRLRDYGLQTEIFDGDSDGYTQQLALEQALISNVRGVIVCPIDFDLLTDGLTTFQAQNIPIVSAEDIPYLDQAVHAFTSNYEMGLEAGRFAGQLIQDERGGQANVLILDFPDLDAIIERADGLEAGVLEVAPEANIVGRYRGATADFGYESLQDILAKGVEFDVIVSINDAGAYGAMDALDEADIPPEEVIIVGIDAEQRMLQHIEDGYYARGTLAVERSAVAEAYSDMMVRMLAGEAVAQLIEIPPGMIVSSENLTE